MATNDKIIRNQAEKIADALLTYHGIKKEKAKRLVLELDKKLSGPGWGRSGLILMIERILSEQ